MSSNIKVRAHELSAKSKTDLLKQLDELKMELHKLRVQKVANTNASKITKITAVRKGIARILTVITSKQREALRAHYKGKKYMPLDLRTKKTRAIRRKLTKHESHLITERTQKKIKAFPKRKFARGF